MKRCRSKRELPETAMGYVLESLAPYTDANRKLTFRPHEFFNDLENIERQKEKLKRTHPYKRSTLQQAFSKAKRNDYLEFNEFGMPVLTEAGRRKIQPYRASKLSAGAYLLVVFDIPEYNRDLRDHLRRIFKELEFEQIQKSVWKTQYDHRALLREEIKFHGLREQVQVYEAIRIT
jgi:hypothetical protein